MQDTANGINGCTISDEQAGRKSELSDALFARYAELIYSTAGIKLSSQKKVLLLSRLQKRINMQGLRNLEEYYSLVREDEEERVLMLNCISTNTTKFFRENHHFEYLMGKVVPELVVKKAQERTLRIWSAGCSTGEEPYSIAVSVSKALSGLPVHGNFAACQYGGWDVKVLATDISTRVLEKAQDGIYDLEQIPGEMQGSGLPTYFLKGSGENAGKIMVKEFVKEVVRFRRFNLKEDSYPFRGLFDVIFCRNVMIYFDDGMREHVLERFHRHLSPDGYLFLGHSETMHGQGRFKPVHITTYRKI